MHTSIARSLNRYFGVQLTQMCSNAVFSFTMSSNMHHLRTAYSLDGKTWVCASDYLDTGVPLVRIEGIEVCLCLSVIADSCHRRCICNRWR